MAGFDRGVRPMGDWSMATTLSTCFTPSMRLVLARRGAGPVDLGQQDCSRMSLTRVDLPDPDTPVTATRHPSGKATSMSLQVVLARPAHDELLAGPGPALVGDRDEPLAGEVAAR